MPTRDDVEMWAAAERFLDGEFTKASGFYKQYGQMRPADKRVLAMADMLDRAAVIVRYTAERRYSQDCAHEAQEWLDEWDGPLPFEEGGPR